MSLESIQNSITFAKSMAKTEILISIDESHEVMIQENDLKIPKNLRIDFHNRDLID